MSRANLIHPADTVQQRERRHRVALYVLFTAVVFCLFLITMAVVVGAVVALIHLNVLQLGTAHFVEVRYIGNTWGKESRETLVE